MPIHPDLLENLRSRRAVALAGGGEDKRLERHAKGQLHARERLIALFQANTFMEWGLHADHDCHDFGLEKKSLPGEGVVTGVGYVDGRPFAA